VSNNLLHNRTGFRESATGESKRVLLRTRYLDRAIAPSGPDT
jgi:hypothetical protein